MVGKASPLHRDAELTRPVAQFIARHIDSVGALDLLLLLHEQRDRDWSSSELCARLRCPDGWADGELRRLRDLGIVVTTGDRHRYVRDGRHGAAVDAVATACRRDRAAVVRRIFARRRNPGEFVH